jgi:hypothetical protein
MKNAVPQFLTMKIFTKIECRRDLRQHMSNLFEKQELTDVTFTDHKNQISAHRGFLGTISYFDSLFKFNEKKEIEIVNFNLNSYKIILKYIYTKKINFKKASLVDLMFVYEFSDQILINDLKIQVIHFLKKSINEENAGIILQFCRNFNIEGSLRLESQKYFNSTTVCEMVSSLEEKQNLKIQKLETELIQSKAEIESLKLEMEKLRALFQK